MPEVAPLTVACNVRDGAHHVAGWASSLQEQTRRPVTVLVLDDGSTDGTPERLEEWFGAPHRPRLRLERRPPRGLQAARRELLSLVDTPLVILVDIDIRLLPHALETMLDAMVDGVAAVGGRTRNREPGLAAQAHDAVRQLLYRRRADTTGTAQWLEGSPTMWRTDVLRLLGGSEAGAISEDLDLSFKARRAGHRLVLLPKVVATHPDPPTWRALWRRERDTGRREGRMAANGERQILRGVRRIRVAPLAGPLYLLVMAASLALVPAFPHHRLAAWWAFHWMQFAYSAGFVAGYRDARADLSRKSRAAA